MKENKVINLINNLFKQKQDIDFEILTDEAEVEKYMYQQWEMETVWLDLREEKSVCISFDEEFSKKLNQDYDFWEEEVYDNLENIVKNTKYKEFFNDIENDLYNCYINEKHNLNNDFWNKVFEIYAKGYLPCGWKGSYPNGNFVVF